jgi:hypothetical protein
LNGIVEWVRKVSLVDWLHGEFYWVGMGYEWDTQNGHIMGISQENITNNM